MAFSFRLRINRASGTALQSNERKLFIHLPERTTALVLKAGQNEKSLQETEALVLEGHDYRSTRDAEAEGRRFAEALMVGLARIRVGSDFGLRGPKGGFTAEGLAQLSAEQGYRVLNCEHGLMVYETGPPTAFVATTGGELIRNTYPEALERAFLSYVQSGAALTEREIMAYTLFNASFFQQTPDSRFLLLVMAIEILLEPQLRSAVAIEHVNQLIQLTRDSDLEARERDSMLGTLKWLKRESIGQAGKRLAAERLPGRRYLDQSAPAFFSHCYGLRSDLVHGNLPIPSFNDINFYAANLEVFVSDLLTSPYLGLPTD